KVEVELLAAPALAPASREALGLFLLNANRSLRLARATVEESASLITVGFEALLDSSADELTVDLALGACSVACEMCSHEIKALQDESLAREYLAVRGSSFSTSMRPSRAKGEAQC